MKKVNKKLTREERINKLYRIDKIELPTGKLIWNLIGGIIATGIFLGFMTLLGMFINWIEQNTIRLIIYLIIGFIAIARMTIKEINR